MTAQAEQAAAAASAQVGGESDARVHAVHAEAMQASISGSEIEVTDTDLGPESSAVAWPKNSS